MVTNPFRMTGFIFSGFFGFLGVVAGDFYVRYYSVANVGALMCSASLLWCSWSIFRDAYGLPR